jgi:hypothetical protein
MPLLEPGQIRHGGNGFAEGIGDVAKTGLQDFNNGFASFLQKALLQTLLQADNAQLN